MTTRNIQRTFQILAVLLVASQLATAPVAAAEPTVKLVIDYGDSVQKHFTALPHSDDMTVLDAMQLAKKHPRGIRFEHRGKGATAFLTKIDDVENEGKGRNWLFYVNDKRAEQGCGVYKLKPGDVALWKFEKYR